MATSFCDCWYLTGPTAIGKTAIGLELAQLLDAEIVSLDSMTVYREMDIGTAKPTGPQQSLVPHHLIDIVDPTKEYSLSSYLEAARVTVDQIRGRGREVLFVGGTPLYLKALLYGIFDGPPADWEFREQVAKEVREVGAQALHDRLKLIDPLSAARLHQNDVRRIVRALEVHRLTGQPISHLQLQFDEPVHAHRVFVLDRPRPELHERIRRRVQAMMSHGLIDEVRQLMGRYGRLSRTASQAVGYREIIAFLQGQWSQPDAIRRIQSRTNRFARRQLTWFRSLPACRPISLGRDEEPADVARRILDAADA